MINKIKARIRRAARTRYKLKQLNSIRLVVHRTARHIYAQIISQNNLNILVSSSTLEKKISEQLFSNTGNKNSAAIVGKILAERALEKGIRVVSFDRSGYRYHGRVKELAESARKNGLQF